ncbi:MAG: repressor LexA [Verrucomicrobiaceae bacterium]|nr:repressor LexA [Verrucomicrobiaceae bacterium]
MINHELEEKLTERQAELLAYLREYQRDQGVMPSTREIQRHFGFASQTAAMSHLRALEKKGVIQRYAGKARAVVLPEILDRPEIVTIPVFGQIPAGLTSDALQHADGCIVVDLKTLGVPRNAKTFALKVRGDSMIGAHICNGDFVVVDAGRTARNKDIVAALIDGETTLKRFIMRGDVPYLKAENPNYPDLVPARELFIQGVMVGLVRHFNPAEI